MGRHHSSSWRTNRNAKAHARRRLKRRNGRRSQSEYRSRLNSDIARAFIKAGQSHADMARTHKYPRADSLAEFSMRVRTSNGNEFYLDDPDTYLMEALYERYQGTQRYKSREARFVEEHKGESDDFTLKERFLEQEQLRFTTPIADKVYGLYGKHQIENGDTGRHEKDVEESMRDDNITDDLKELIKNIDRAEREWDAEHGKNKHAVKIEMPAREDKKDDDDMLLIDVLKSERLRDVKHAEKVAREASTVAQQAQEQASASASIAQSMEDERDAHQEQAEQAKSSALYAWSMKSTQSTFNKTPQQTQNRKGRVSGGGGRRGGQVANASGGRSDVNSKSGSKGTNVIQKQRSDALAKRKQVLQKQIATLQKRAQALSKRGDKKGADALKKRIEALRKQLNALSKNEGQKGKGKKKK